jgi:hypothetical protein
MVKPTRNLDDLLRDALAAEDAEVVEGLEDQSAVELLVEVFRGRHRLFAAVGVVVNIALFVVGVGAAIAFANAEDVRTMLLYAGASALSFAGVLAIKIWYWLEMTRLAVTREVKRVELQIVQLSRRMRDREGQ